MGAVRKYPDELRDRAVRLVLGLVKDQEASVTPACRKVGGELGIKAGLSRRRSTGGCAGDLVGGCGADPGAVGPAQP